jgi:hypothetical protein
LTTNLNVLRQWPALERVIEVVETNDTVEGALLIGSLAAGAGDPLSDVDVIVVAREGCFEQTWAGGAKLTAGALAVNAVKHAGGERIGRLEWLTEDLVFVECLIATPDSGVRLAPPHLVLSGPADLPGRLPPRGPIQSPEMGPGGWPVGDRYDALKEAVRGIS